MTTLTNDLELALKWARSSYPGTDSEIVGDEVYLNYGFREAVCIGAAYLETGKAWYASAYTWDRTGGVSDEHDIALGSLGVVLDKVIVFLMRQAVEEDKLERLLNQRPEDLA